MSKDQIMKALMVSVGMGVYYLIVKKFVDSIMP
jgi:hypothetical protein